MPKSFALTIPQKIGDPKVIDQKVAQMLFVLGANGTGKSALMQHFFAQHRDVSTWIAAHRQNWTPSKTLNVSAATRNFTEANIRGSDNSPDARWKDDFAPDRPSNILFDLVNAEYIYAKQIAAAASAKNYEAVEKLERSGSCVKIINELFRSSNLPVEVNAKGLGEIVAKKNAGTEFSIAQLSDGERNALLIAASVLTAKPGSLLLIDEPERHLHRSIISPLLSQLFKKRKDCAFVISTHEIMLPIDNRSASALVLNGCDFVGEKAVSWDADILEPNAEVADEVKRDILGARRKIIFVEGTVDSLDLPLYSLVFPDVSVIGKGNSRSVEQAVSGINDTASTNWIHAWGIVDNDGRSQENIEKLKTRRIHATSDYAVESIYYHTNVQRRVCEQKVDANRGEGREKTNDIQRAAEIERRLREARIAALKAIESQVERLCRRAAEKTVREQIFNSLPSQTTIKTEQPIDIHIDVANEVARAKERVRSLIDSDNLSEIIEKYPIKETNLTQEIATKLGFEGRAEYESAVRNLLLTDSAALSLVRTMFLPLFEEISAT